MAAATPRASGLWEHSDMTYSQLSASDPSDDAEGNEVDSRTPLDKTIDQIGMGTCFLPPPGPCLCPFNLTVSPLRHLSMGPSLSLWFRCVTFRSLFVRAVTEVFFVSSLQGWLADNVSSIPQLLRAPLQRDIRCGCKQ